MFFQDETGNTHIFIGPIWKSGGYNGFALSFHHSVILSFCNLWNENFSSHFSQELWSLEGWNLVHTWTMGGCIVYTGIRLLLHIHPIYLETWYTRVQWMDVSCLLESGCCCLFIPLFLHFSFPPIFKHYKFSSHFSQELWGLEGWNLVHKWTMGGCIVYTGIRLLLHIQPIYFFIFLSLQFSNIKFFVTLFAGTVRLRRLTLDTHVDSGPMYGVYWNQAAAAYSSHYFFLFLSLQFSNIKIFRHTFLRNCEA